MERKLASIQKVLDVQPIPNADAIEVLTILGWKVVAKKGEFKVGDLVVYFEVDSILKESPEVEFLRKSNFRIKTIKLRGQVSQGLCLPLSILPPMDDTLSQAGISTTMYDEGDDITELLGVEKYEVYVPAQLAGERKGNFPDWLSKTDEMRIQAVPELLYKHQNKPFYVTEKVDGSSMTAYIKDGEFGVCSRNFDMKETETNSFWKVARSIDLENKMRSLKRNFAFQGELLGPGVQGNKLKLSKLDFYIFNATDINTGLHFNYDELRKYTEFLSLTNVPLVDTNYILPATVDELVEYSKGCSSLNSDVHREGVVFRPLVNEYSEELRGRLSFKCINPDFLLKYNE